MKVLDGFRLDGKIALVTGASHGIGEGLAVAFAEAGADVALAARNVADLERVAGRITAAGRRAAVVQTDVSDLAQVERMFTQTASELGEPGILANVAGTNVRNPILKVTPEEWEFLLNVNLRSVYFASQAFVRRLVVRDAGWGKIINIASMTSYRGFEGLSVYGVTKVSVLGLTKMQAVEWAPYGIRVNAIAPGWIETPLTATMSASRRKWVEDHVPQGHYGVPADLAGLAVYLASSASDYCTGQTFPVDGGFVAGSPWPSL